MPHSPMHDSVMNLAQYMIRMVKFNTRPMLLYQLCVMFQLKELDLSYNQGLNGSLPSAWSSLSQASFSG